MARLLYAGFGYPVLVCALGLTGCGTSPQASVQRGNRYYDSGKFDDAAIQYRKALQKAPAMGEAHYRLGLVELKRNNPGEAYKELRQGADLMPDNADATAQFGRLVLSFYTTDPRHAKEFHDQANSAADRLLAHNPQNFEGNLLKGEIAILDKTPDDAADYFREAIGTKPSDPSARLGLARALADSGQKAAGIAAARDLIAADKTFGPAYDFLLVQYRSSGNEQDAEDILKLKVANNPGQSAALLELARYYASRQKPAEVAATIQKLLDNPRAFPDGRLLAGNFYASVGKPDEALKNYSDGLKANPKNPIPWQKGIFGVLASQRKYADALAEANTVLKEKPDDSEMKLARAQLWLAEGKPENLEPAIAELRTEAKGHPGNFALRFQLGNALARKGDWTEAQREWTAAAQDRNYLPPRYALVQASLQNGDAESALRIAEEIIAVAPRDPQARLVHAICLTGAGQYLGARTELDRLSAEYPRSPQVRFRRGVLAISEGKFDEAESIFRALETQAGTDPAVFAGLAEAYQGKNESAKAIQMLEDELKRNPKSPMLHQILARVAAASGKYDVAVEQYKEMAAAAPHALGVQLGLASSYIAEGNLNDGIGVLEKAVQAEPKSEEASFELAHALVSAGRVNDAKTRYRRAIELQPDDPRALNDLAYLMADSGENLDQALSYATRGMQHASEPGLKTSLSDTLGWIYLKKKMYDDALQTFQALVNNNPNNPTYHYHLGLTLYQKGDRNKARTELQAALADKPSPSVEPGIRELLARL